MVRSGASGSVFSVMACFVALAVACGGSSETHGDSDGDKGGKSGAGGTSSGTSAGADGGTSGGTGAAGATAGIGAAGASAGGNGALGGAGASGPIDPPGPSFCGGQPCDPPLACCLATGQCFNPGTNAGLCETPDPDNDPQGRKACASSAQCGENEYCQVDGLSCQGTGHCQPIDNCGGCDGTCKVCGCDGNTYPNAEPA